MDNAVRCEDGKIEVYTHNIYSFVDEYISSLNNPDDIYNTSCFDGMLDYIYTHVFKPKLGDKIYYNTRNTILDTSDIDMLDNLFHLLKGLCGKYRKRITLLRFCSMIGIGNDVISQWISGECRSGADGASSLHCQTAKKWKMMCEAALFSGVVDDNSVGCIFALKANYGYVDQPQRIEIVDSDGPRLSREEISSRFRSLPEFQDAPDADELSDIL